MFVLVTDGGPHPPEKWAHVSTLEILKAIQLAPDVSPRTFAAYNELQVQLFNLLVQLHDEQQKTEQGRLKDHAHLNSPLHPLAHEGAMAAVDKVTALTLGTPFEAHFKSKDVQEHIYRVLGQHFADSLHIERCYHADRNKDSNEHVRAFDAKRFGK